MIRRDLLAGYWAPYLERAVTLKPCYDGGIDGGEVDHANSFIVHDIFPLLMMSSLLLVSESRWLLKYCRTQLWGRNVLSSM